MFGIKAPIVPSVCAPALPLAIISLSALSKHQRRRRGNKETNRLLSAAKTVRLLLGPNFVKISLSTGTGTCVDAIFKSVKLQIGDSLRRGSIRGGESTVGKWERTGIAEEPSIARA
jgi:hypothetical protein